MTVPLLLNPQAESLVSHLAADMAREGIEAKTLTLKLKTTAFEVGTGGAGRRDLLVDAGVWSRG